MPALLAAAAASTAALAAAARRVFASRRWPVAVRRLPHQVTLLARCLAEAACVRTGRRFTGGMGTVVVLSASEALHGAAGLLGGHHVRFVHELVTTEDAALRLLGHLTRRGERRVRVLAPTDAVREGLSRLARCCAGPLSSKAASGRRAVSASSTSSQPPGRSAAAIVANA